MNEKAVTDLKDLKIRGDVIAPGDEKYDDARKVYNAMKDKRPAVMVGMQLLLTSRRWEGEEEASGMAENRERLSFRGRFSCSRPRLNRSSREFARTAIMKRYRRPL